jgi:hypothetical protein
MKGSYASSRAHPSRVLETIVPGFLFLAHGSGLNAFREHAHPPYLQHCLFSAIPTYIRALETIAHGGRRHTRTHTHIHIHTHSHIHTHTHSHTHVHQLKYDLTYCTCRSDLHTDRRSSKLSRRAVEMQDSYASSRACPSKVFETIVPGVSFLAQGSVHACILRARTPYMQQFLLTAIITTYLLESLLTAVPTLTALPTYGSTPPHTRTHVQQTKT